MLRAEGGRLPAALSRDPGRDRSGPSPDLCDVATGEAKFVSVIEGKGEFWSFLPPGPPVLGVNTSALGNQALEIPKAPQRAPACLLRGNILFAHVGHCGRKDPSPPYRGGHGREYQVGLTGDIIPGLLNPYLKRIYVVRHKSMQISLSCYLSPPSVLFLGGFPSDLYKSFSTPVVSRREGRDRGLLRV